MQVITQGPPNVSGLLTGKAEKKRVEKIFSIGNLYGYFTTEIKVAMLSTTRENRMGRRGIRKDAENRC
jgi:hypothetical protein